MPVQGSPRKQKQAGFISRLCGTDKKSEDADVPGKKWVQVFDHTGAKSVLLLPPVLSVYHTTPLTCPNNRVSV